VVGVSLEPENDPVVHEVKLGVPGWHLCDLFLVKLFTEDQPVVLDVLDDLKKQVWKSGYNQKEPYSIKSHLYILSLLVSIGENSSQISDIESKTACKCRFAEVPHELVRMNESVEGVNIEIRTFVTCDWILCSSYLLVVKIDVFDGVDCELEQRHVDFTQES